VFALPAAGSEQRGGMDAGNGKGDGGDSDLTEGVQLGDGRGVKGVVDGCEADKGCDGCVTGRGWR
jgi:hypothetical protein